MDELNTTGAFPDETDKTPMVSEFQSFRLFFNSIDRLSFCCSVRNAQCYIRCYLNAVGILKDDELNREKANEMAWATSEDTLEECEKEVTGK